MEKRYLEIPELRSHLTERQFNILGSIVMQEPSSKACTRLGITVKTLETHKRNVRDKFGVDDNHSLIITALKIGILPKIIHFGANPDIDHKFLD